MLNIRETTQQEDSAIARHFYKMWLDNNIPVESIQPNCLEIILQFIDRARQELAYKAFVAEINGEIVGSASCQLFAGLYPDIIIDRERKYGYIWGVYVEPNYRKQGIAKKLTAKTIEYLKAIDCTRAILNASPSGKSVYLSLGFSESNEMLLDLV
ncbi:MAG: GNAT family N-acetyltransferase [Xenococcaceae cyanobacterium]